MSDRGGFGQRVGVEAAVVAGVAVPPTWSTSSSPASPSKLPVKRTTFVIDTDRTVLELMSSEVKVDSHVDKALEVLRPRKTNAR